jgi:predicted nuclease of predicted toxin-antitoxin system
VENPRLRLLADANVPAALVDEIRNGGGIDIRTAQEMGVARLADPELFRWAKRSGRALLTMDEDLWSERRYPRGEGGGIVFLNVGPQHTSRALEAFVLSYSAFLQGYGNGLLDGLPVKVNVDTFTIRLRTHARKLDAWEVRLHRRSAQVREVPTS